MAAMGNGMEAAKAAELMKDIEVKMDPNGYASYIKVSEVSWISLMNDVKKRSE